MAVICTLLASGGFAAAGYSDVSAADASAARSPQNIHRVADSGAASGFSRGNELENFDPVAAGAVGLRMSFANMLIQARKPVPERIIDLTDPDGNTPQLAQGILAMRASVPEISSDQMSQVRRDILTAAYMGLGHHYVWGGTSFSSGWDCSGFVQWAYGQAGIGLPRTEQWMPMIETSNPQPGDLVVQNPDGPNHWSHIGIYIGHGKMISALNPSVGTILHAPGDVSSSSSYFTMPAFAAADEKAKAAVKTASETGAEKANEKLANAAAAHPSASPSMKPSTTPADKPSDKPVTKPATTPPVTKPPATTAPVTKPPATTAPVTKPPATTAPVTTPPVTKPPATTAPVTTAPVTKPPATTAPVTKPPATTPPATTPPATTPPATTPSATLPMSTSTAPSPPAGGMTAGRTESPSFPSSALAEPSANP